jgi:isopenicillin-N N-acyltransferase-like protein
MDNIPATFPYFRFEGSHYEIGKQIGQSTADLIHRHRDLALNRLERQLGISAKDALENSLAYRPYIQRHAPFFDEEVRGIADGSGLTLQEAYLLQLRAELGVVTREAISKEPGDECTTFAALPEATSDGVGILGQNADLPAFYSEIGVVIEYVFDDMPSVLMLTPAGQVSYIGINDRGLGVCANYLSCEGWRVGFPRYLLSRLALTHETVDDALAAVRGVHRASSRNLLMLDAHGGAADLETTAADDARIDPERGMIAHANHYTSGEMLRHERAKSPNLENSQQRHATMRELLDNRYGEINPAVMQSILRDRSCLPDSLCRMPEDNPDSDTITFASLIAQPSKGQMWISVGPPNEHEYYRYAFGAQPVKEDLQQKVSLI